MSVKLTYEYVKSYIESFVGYILLSKEYVNNSTKLEIKCPKGHIFFMTYNKFHHGRRCAICSGKKKHTINYIKTFASENETKCKSDIYINAHSYLIFECKYHHEYKMSWANFQQGHRCNECYRNNNYGKNHPNYNPNRNEIPINRILRNPRSKSWIKKHMVHDPNYDNYLNNPDNFHLDHKIPIKLFCELYTKYNINEIKLKKIINKIDNLQLLTVDENRKKNYKGRLEEATQYLIDNGIKIENRNYSNVS